MQRRDRPEELRARDLRLGADSLHDRRRHVEAGPVEPLSAGDDSRAGCACALYGAEHVLELPLVDHRAEVVLVVRTDLLRLGQLDKRERNSS